MSGTCAFANPGRGTRNPRSPTIRAGEVSAYIGRTIGGRTVVYMADQKPDLDERFSLDMEGEEVIRRLLDDEPTDDFQDEEGEAPEDGDT
jgi:hypothetical protein